jgi:hypothetical protein
VFGNAETLGEAEVVADSLIQVADRLGIGRGNIRAILLRSVPEDAEWTDEAEPMIDRLLEEETDEPSVPEPGVDEEVVAYTTPEALAAYAQALEADPEDPATVERLRALRERLSGEIAGDTLALLAERLEDVERRNVRQARDLEEAEEELRDATSGGLISSILELADDLGFGFGWWTLYSTILLSWLNGQTVGKKVMWLRVVRLDGEPVTWWTAFERGGGYVAGFATGLLGFAQVYWESNRQAIHDRIVGTVVVVDGADKVIDWESTL